MRALLFICEQDEDGDYLAELVPELRGFKGQVKFLEAREITPATRKRKRKSENPEPATQETP